MGNGIKKRMQSAIIVVMIITAFFILNYNVSATSPSISVIEPSNVYNETANSYATVNVSVTDGTNQVSTFIDWNEGLIAYWNFESLSATGVYDNSTHSNFGTFASGLLESDNLTGKYGTAMNFDGVDNHINCGTGAANEDYDAMTIEAWIRRDSNTPSGWRTPLHRNDGTSVGTSVFFIGLEATTHDITATIGAGSDGPGYQSGNTNIPAQLDTWYHVLNSWDGTTARVYVNGIKILEYALSSDNFNNKASAITMIGTSYSAAGYNFAGDIDEVRIWSRALSHNEINASYNSTVNNFLQQNFTGLTTYNYSYYAHAMNTAGEESNTSTRYVNVSLILPDTTDPVSSVTGISPYIQISSPLTINASASDVGGDGVKNVTLWYRNSTDNVTWSTAVGGADWWNAEWAYRKLITINSSQVDATLTNFPILVYSGSDGNLLGGAQSDGDDIVFIDYNDNSTQYNHEIEYYDSSTGSLYAWVNITTLSSSTDTKVWMYYGNLTCSSQQNKHGTWDANYSQVLHLSETDIDNDAGDIKDSTDNYINASTVNMEVADHITGQVAGAMVFDGTGSNEYIDTAFTDSISSGIYTINIWVTDIPIGSKYVVCQHDASYSSDFILGYDQGGYWGDGSTKSGDGIISTPGWHQLGFTITTGSPCTSKLYIDGVYKGTVAGPTPPALGQSIKLMAQGDGASSYCSGKADEYRVSNVIRNDSWIATEYATIKNQTTFISIGSEEGGGWREWDNATQNPDSASPWQWNFNFPNGTGYYEFYSIACDNASNEEGAPDTADTRCQYTIVYSSVDAISPYNQTSSPLTITASGGTLDNATLYYRWSSDNISWSASSVENWYDTNFTYRKLITVDHNQVDNTLTNFPILVHIDSDLSGHAQSDADDIFFILYSDNATKLNHEIENYTSGILWAWVNVTTLSSSSDTLIWMYYGNSTCGSQEHVNGTWDSNYVMVQHMYDNPDTSHIQDSTSYSNDGTKRAADEPVEDMSSKIDSGQTFDGSNDYVDCSNAGHGNYNSMTISAWWKASSFSPTRWRTMLHRNVDTSVGSSVFFIGLETGSNQIVSTIGAGTGAGYMAGKTGINAQTDKWYHVVASWNGTNTKVYVNGDLKKTYPLTTLNYKSATTMIGTSWDSTGYRFNGAIDEVRISNSSRNASWIGAMHDTTNSSTFCSYGNEVEYSTGTGCAWMKYTNDTNPDLGSPWSWSFIFSNGTGYYEFYSIGKKYGEIDETVPGSADTRCHYTYGVWNSSKTIAWKIVNSTDIVIFNLTLDGNISIKGILYESSSKPAGGTIAFEMNNSLWLTIDGDLHLTGTKTTVSSPIWIIENITNVVIFKFKGGDLEIIGSIFENV